MTKPEIEAFLAVAQYGSLSAAAEQIFVTQPALTRRIQSLEQELGYRLFKRGKGIRGSSLTESGRAFLPIARRWNAICREALALQGGSRKPTFRLSSVSSASRLLLPGIFGRMTEACLLDFHLCHSVEGYSLIENDAADAVLIDYLRSGGYSTASVRSIPVYSVPFAVVGGKAWKGVPSVRASELDPSREIILHWNMASDAWHDRTFDPAIRPVAYLDDSAAVKYVLRDDLFAVMPKTVGMRLSLESEDIHMIELEDGPPDDIIHCLTPPSGNENPLLKLFLETVKDCCESLPGVRSLLDVCE